MFGVILVSVIQGDGSFAVTPIIIIEIHCAGIESSVEWVKGGRRTSRRTASTWKSLKKETRWQQLAYPTQNEVNTNRSIITSAGCAEETSAAQVEREAEGGRIVKRDVCYSWYYIHIVNGAIVGPV